MCEDSRAQDMLRIISQAPMSKQVRNRFEEFAANGDAGGMYQYFDNCLKNKPQVGEQVEKSGHKSFESMANEVKSIYEGASCKRKNG